jgi:hypothetical protein
MEFFGKIGREGEKRMQSMVDILKSLLESRVPRSASAKLCCGALVNWLEMAKGRSGFFQKSILCLSVIGYFVCAHKKLNINAGSHALEL